MHPLPETSRGTLGWATEARPLASQGLETGTMHVPGNTHVPNAHPSTRCRGDSARNSSPKARTPLAPAAVLGLDGVPGFDVVPGFACVGAGATPEPFTSPKFRALPRSRGRCKHVLSCASLMSAVTMSAHHLQLTNRNGQSRSSWDLASCARAQRQSHMSPHLSITGVHELAKQIVLLHSFLPLFHSTERER